MAISATFELRDPNSSATRLKGMVLDSYTVIDLDYTLKRIVDKTNRPVSAVIIDCFYLTIRGTKELKTPFHEWLWTADKQMDGIIKIYDSAGFISSTAQDFTGGSAPVDLSLINDMVTDEIEDNLNDVMDNASKYRDSNDIFDEMDRTELLNYIASKGLKIDTEKSNSDDDIREKIRYYNQICNMDMDRLSKEVELEDVTMPDKKKDGEGNDIPYTREDYIKALVDNRTSDKSNNPANKSLYKTADKMKSATSKTLSSAANSVVKLLESARSITFKNAYCVSLREHFVAKPKQDGSVDATYPWILQLGIRPGTVLINGANIGGSTVVGDLEMKFF